MNFKWLKYLLHIDQVNATDKWYDIGTYGSPFPQEYENHKNFEKKVKKRKAKVFEKQRQMYGTQ